MPAYRPILERFNEKVDKSDASGCWKWNGAISNKGYGVIGLSRIERVGLAHRVSWELHNGAIPDKLCVLHKCDNPRCVNPDHLFLGTHTDNMRDCSLKDRTSHGERHGSSKLSEADVVELRRLSLSGVSYSRLAAKFGITISTAWMAAKAVNWRRVQ